MDSPGLGKQLGNGIVFRLTSVGVIVIVAADDGLWDLSDMALAVAVSTFLSGLCTS